MRTLVILPCVVAAALAAAAGDVAAQPRRDRPEGGPAAAGYGPAPRAGYGPYSQPAGRTGPVSASTPNRDGNLGGPSTGGGGSP